MIVYSANDEDFNYFEISDLLNDNPELVVGDIIYKAEAKKPNILDFIDVEDIYDLIIDRAYDYGGDYADDFSYELRNDKALQNKLKASLKRWAKGLPAITFYSVGKSEQQTLTEEDFED